MSKYPAVTVATYGNALNSDKIKPSKSDNVYVTDYLPGDWIMNLADALIFFGGNATAYQALTNGTPQITIPLHLDQQDNANQLKRLGTSIILNPYKISKETLLPALSEILYDPKYSKASRKFQNELKDWNGPKKAADEIEEFISKKV